MLKNRAFAFMAALLMTLTAWSCGKTQQKAEPEREPTTAEETTVPSTTASGDKTTDKSDDKEGRGIDLSFGMLGYVKKSKKSSANANASSMYKSVCTVLVDEEKKFTDNIIYSNTGEEDEFNKSVNKYFEPIEPLEYIIVPDKYGQPEIMLCSKNTKKDDYVGAYGDSQVISDLREKTWAEVLKIYGFEEGKYTDIKLETDDLSNYSYTHEQPQGIDFDDADAVESCDLAAAIAWEYNRGVNDIPVYLYGKWSKDTPFTAITVGTDMEVPEHGDIEYVLEFNGFSVSNVFCWDTDRDRKSVGDADMGFGYTNFVGKTWDDVLEYYGYTQGEYVEY